MTQKTILSNSVLDDAYQLLQRRRRQDTYLAMQKLCSYLAAQKKALSPTAWVLFKNAVKDHPINTLLLEAPQLAHSQCWPRGYSGDAEMMDLIYGMGNSGQRLAQASSLGAQINEVQNEWPTHRAANRRLKRIAKTIDQVASEKPGVATILSIACGHLREAAYCHAPENALIAKWIALDQDEASLSLVQQNYQRFPIECKHQSITSLLKGDPVGSFDLIYAAGLYDYLQINTAKKLTTTLFESLQAGGRLLIANFTPHTTEMGFLETFMDWPLIYRNMKEMAQLTTDLPPDQAEVKIYDDLLNSHNRLVYLEVKRKIA